MLTLSQLYDGTIGQIATDIRYINVGRMYAHTVLVVFHCHSQFLSENRPCSPLLLHVCVFHGRSPDRHGAGGEGHWCYSSWWQGGLLRSSVALVCLSGKLNMLDKVGYTPNSSSAGSLFLQKGFVWVREMMCTNQVHFWIKRKIVFMFSCNT